MVEATMKNILLLVHDDIGQEARLQAALDITRAVGGHLNCLDVVITPIIAGSDWSGYGTAMLLEDERTREITNRQALEKRLAVEGVSWTWINATGELTACLERAAVLNELIVVNRQLDDFPYPDMRTASADIVVRSGKPVLAVPEHVVGFNVGGRALVAWDGSRQADAALLAATPLLRLAGNVTLLEIDDGSVEVPAEAAATFLSRHDVHPLIVRDKAQKGEAGGRLLQIVARLEPHYLVMGGFGHSRLSEAMLGGVTRTLLTKSPVPLFLAH
jgi:nucleotide-binding universal stress UspA family protein